MAFQQSVNAVPAPGIAGDFASTNPRHYVVAGPSGFVAGPLGLVCGRFAWADPATGSVLTNSGQGKPTGFVRNSHSALITTYLGSTSYTIPAGFGVIDIFDVADFFVKNDGTTTAIPGQKVYASNATGQVIALAATGTLPTGGTGTASTIAAGTATSVTGSIAVSSTINPSPIGPGTAPAVLTVTAVGSGALVVGGILSGTGVVTGTQIVSQLSGTTGGVGTYVVSYSQTVASTTITQTYGLLTVGGTVTGSFAVNDTITGSTTSAGTYITALGTGTGGAGTYIVNNTQTVGSASLSAYSGVETDWFVANGSFGAPGERIKISKLG